MHISDENDGTLVGESGFSRNGGKGAPFLQVKRDISVWDKSVSLGVSRGTDENPAKHGVTSVPFLSLDRGSPSVLGKLGPFLVPCLRGLGHGFLVRNLKVGGAERVKQKESIPDQSNIRKKAEKKRIR
jgi:hypothetical protein